MKIAFFDTNSYDKTSFEACKGELEFRFFEAKLTEDTADLTKGFDAVCVFVNDTLNAAVIDRLYENGVRLIALRCAGYISVERWKFPSPGRA